MDCDNNLKIALSRQGLGTIPPRCKPNSNETRSLTHKLRKADGNLGTDYMDWDNTLTLPPDKCGSFFECLIRDGKTTHDHRIMHCFGVE